MVSSDVCVLCADSPRCNVCHTVMSPADYEQPVNQAPCDHQIASACCRQRRVHSVSHIDYPQGTSSPSFSRALSCSPTRTHPPVTSPFPPGNYQYQSPPPQPAPKMTTFGHVETLKERLTGNKGDYLSQKPLHTQELCESRGGRPGLSVLTSLLVSVDVKLCWTMLWHWS